MQKAFRLLITCMRVIYNFALHFKWIKWNKSKQCNLAPKQKPHNFFLLICTLAFTSARLRPLLRADHTHSHICMYKLTDSVSDTLVEFIVYANSKLAAIYCDSPLCGSRVATTSFKRAPLQRIAWLERRLHICLCNVIAYIHLYMYVCMYIDL